MFRVTFCLLLLVVQLRSLLPTISLLRPCHFETILAAKENWHVFVLYMCIHYFIKVKYKDFANRALSFRWLAA